MPRLVAAAALLAMAAAAAAAAAAGAASCPETPGECVSDAEADTVMFEKAGQAVRWNVTFWCRSRGAPSGWTPPSVGGVEVSSPSATLAYNASGQSVADGPNCTLQRFAFELKPRVTTEVVVHFDDERGSESQLDAIACLASAPACNTTCCTGAEKWDAARVAVPPCDEKRCCCPSDVRVASGASGSELSVTGWLNGAACPGPHVNGRVPLETGTLPMVAGPSLEFFLLNRTFTVSLRAGSDGKVGTPVVGNLSWSGASCLGDAVRGGHHGGRRNGTLAVAIGGAFAAVVVLVIVAVTLRQRKRRADPASRPLVSQP